jgi:hypothetical protein
LDDFFDKNTLQVIEFEHVLTVTSDISDVTYRQTEYTLAEHASEHDEEKWRWIRHLSSVAGSLVTAWQKRKRRKRR